MVKRILRWRPGGYLRASGGLFGWLILRAIAQAAMVLLLARILGAEGYGLFVAVLAVAGFFAPLAGLGLGVLLLRDGSREPERLPQRLGMALALWWPFALVLTLVAVSVISWALPSSVPIPALAVFTFSEVAATSLVELAARVEQSQHRVRMFGGLLAGLALARLVGLLGYAVMLQPDPVGWMWIYAASGLAYAAVVASRLLVRNPPVWPSRRDWAMAREGFPFTVGALSFRLQAEFNKPLLAQAGYGQAGNFSVAQRAVDLASLPLQAMQDALWPRLYAGGHLGRRMFVIAASLVMLALLGAVLLIIAAPWLPRLVGAEYATTVKLIIWLAWLPTLQVVRNLMCAAVIAYGQHAYLTWVYIVGAVVGILLNSVLVPRFGLVGSIWALYCCELVSLLMLLYCLIKRNKPRLVNAR